MADALDVAIVHHLPSAGGAPRVIAEYVARRPGHRFTVYTRMAAPTPGEALVTLPEGVPVRRFPLAAPGGPLGRYLALTELSARGRELAEVVDAGAHDVVFVHPSLLVQNHEVLPHLKTPALCYAPEPLRALHEQEPAFGRPPGLRSRLVRMGLDPYERLRGRLDREHLRAAQRVVTHSRFAAAALERVYGVRPAVVELGVDAAVFTIPDPAPERERRVLSVGALHPLKGHQFVIEALATVAPSRRPELTVVGDRGSLGGQLRRLAARLGVKLRLDQALPFPELVRVYHRAGVLACGQIREPFGLIALEAMAAGAPVVAVDEGGFPETVDGGRTGLLVARDPHAFGAALMDVLDGPELARRLREAALCEVRRRWTWERTAAGYDALLREVGSR